jgi:hypothetical protein
VTENDTNIRHNFAVSSAKDKDVVLTVHRANDILGFRARRDWKIVTALAVDPTTQEIKMRTPEDAQADFDTECKFWAEHVDSLIAAKRSQGNNNDQAK